MPSKQPKRQHAARFSAAPMSSRGLQALGIVLDHTENDAIVAAKKVEAASSTQTAGELFLEMSTIDLAYLGACMMMISSHETQGYGGVDIFMSRLKQYYGLCRHTMKSHINHALVSKVFASRGIRYFR